MGSKRFFKVINIVNDFNGLYVIYSYFGFRFTYFIKNEDMRLDNENNDIINVKSFVVFDKASTMEHIYSRVEDKFYITKKHILEQIRYAVFRTIRDYRDNFSSKERLHRVMNKFK